MVAFQGALEDCGLHDLGFTGPKFTWNNGRFRDHYTQERLDWAVENEKWSSLWTAVHVEVLACCSSDHHPLLRTTESCERRVKKKVFFV